jgi:hypothetical protein
MKFRYSVSGIVLLAIITITVVYFSNNNALATTAKLSRIPDSVV